MEKLLWSMNDINYRNRRNGALLLIYAGAENNARRDSSLLCKAIQQKDISMIIALFKNNVNPNQQKKYENPDFFDIKDVEIAQKFVDQGVNLNAEGQYSPNILWSCIIRHRSLKLFEFYFTHGTDIKKIDVALVMNA